MRQWRCHLARRTELLAAKANEATLWDRFLASTCVDDTSHWRRSAMTGTVRDHVKRAVVRGSTVFGAESQRRRVVALCYHSIHPDKPFATVTPEMFERHLEWLTEHCDVAAMDAD